jgi:hypothetical protein
MKRGSRRVAIIAEYNAIDNMEKLATALGTTIAALVAVP